MTDLLELLRTANVAVTVVTATVLALRINTDWATLTRGWRITILGLLSLILVGTYGSWEALRQAAPVGARTPGVTLSCVLILIGLWVTRHDQHPPRSRRDRH